MESLRSAKALMLDPEGPHAVLQTCPCPVSCALCPVPRAPCLVPPTGPQACPDMPPTGPQACPGMPPADPQTCPCLSYVHRSLAHALLALMPLVVPPQHLQLPNPHAAPPAASRAQPTCHYVVLKTCARSCVRRCTLTSCRAFPQLPAKLWSGLLGSRYSCESRRGRRAFCMPLAWRPWSLCL